MFTILLRSANGWTDNLGPGENSWATKAEAEAACAELRQVWDSNPEFKVVLTEDLSNFSLVG
jgi:hypothetical protein